MRARRAAQVRPQAAQMMYERASGGQGFEIQFFGLRTEGSRHKLRPHEQKPYTDSGGGFCKLVRGQGSWPLFENKGAAESVQVHAPPSRCAGHCGCSLWSGPGKQRQSASPGANILGVQRLWGCRLWGYLYSRGADTVGVLMLWGAHTVRRADVLGVLTLWGCRDSGGTYTPGVLTLWGGCQTADR